MDKAVKIEKRDRRLLFELDRNARASYVDLAERTGLSVDVVRYRTMRLKELGAIKVFTLIPNTAMLGFAFYKIFLKLHNARESDIQQMISYLTKHEAVCWVARTYGRFDLGVTVKVREIFDMGKLLDSIMYRYSSFVRDRVFEVNLVGEYLTRDYFIRNTRRKPRGSIATA
ncbi:MAG: winged helix-turn-helix transcriptional regulator, partial [Bdellovibrionales bacterium]|nr:winged helix-turn-helix transcriptional regulator [Bdellovibrionales bacterium]